MSRSDKPDRFLGGRLLLQQGSYRAGADPVLLAASVPAKSGQSVLDVGTGVGVALFCLAARVAGLRLYGLERDPVSAELARRNARENDISAEIVEGCVSDVPTVLRGLSFDQVLMNPPFFSSGSTSPDLGRSMGRHEDVPLSTWMDAGIRRLKPGGQLTLIQKADRLVDVCNGFENRLGNISILPLSPRVGRDANLIIVSGTKGAKGLLRLRPPFVLHKGDSHEKDEDSYTEGASKILKHGAQFPD